MTRGRRWLWMLFALTLAATAWVALVSDDQTLPETVSAVLRPASAVTSAANAAGVPVLLARRSAMGWPKAEAAGLAAWGPPPAPKMPAVPAAPPASPLPMASALQPPPFPYQLIGRLQQGEQTQALLTGPIRSLALRTGDVVDGQWRVDKVDATTLHITWLPGQLAQQIGYGKP